MIIKNSSSMQIFYQNNFNLLKNYFMLKNIRKKNYLQINFDKYILI